MQTTEPVAWMYETELQNGTTVKRVTGAWELKYKYIVDACDRGSPIPLYTHPANLTDEEAKHHYNKGHEDGRKLAILKTLTDEEIEEVIEIIGYPRTHAMDIYFARALLKKAGEK